MIPIFFSWWKNSFASRHDGSFFDSNAAERRFPKNGHTSRMRSAIGQKYPKGSSIKVPVAFQSFFSLDQNWKRYWQGKTVYILYLGTFFFYVPLVSLQCMYVYEPSLGFFFFLILKSHRGPHLFIVLRAFSSSLSSLPSYSLPLMYQG